MSALGFWGCMSADRPSQTGDPLMPALLPNLCCVGHTAPPGCGGIWASVQLTLDEPRLARTRGAVAVGGMRLGWEVGE